MDIIGRAMAPGAFFCDLIPVCGSLQHSTLFTLSRILHAVKYSPSWVPFQREIKRSKEVIERTVYQPYMDVKKHVERGTAPPSLTRDLITAGNPDPEIEHRNTWAISSMYGAGTETVLSSNSIHFNHPDYVTQTAWPWH